MWPFHRRPKVSGAAFIERETNKVFASRYTEGLRPIFEQAGFPSVVEAELVALRFWMTVAALSLAHFWCASSKRMKTSRSSCCR